MWLRRATAAGREPASAPRAGVEPAAYSLGGSRSIQLSYRGSWPAYRGMLGPAALRGAVQEREYRRDRPTVGFAGPARTDPGSCRFSGPEGELSPGAGTA